VNDDDMSERRNSQPIDEPDTGRRAVWSRRIALAVLIAFVAFVIVNIAVVLAMLYSSAIRGGGGPFGP
jgi:hypothetical protein